MTAGDETLARVEELTLRFLDGQADPAERQELATIVEGDGEARRIHLGIIEVEVALRGGRPAQVAPAVLEQIARERADRAVRGVMSQVSSMTPMARGPRAAPRRRWPLPSVLLAVAVLVIAGVWWRSSAPPTTVALAPTRAVVGRPAVQPPRQVQAVREGAINVVSLDFEDGELPEDLIDGDRAEGSCAPGSQHCLTGTPGRYGGDGATVTIQRFNPPLLSYAPNQILSFDYHVGAEVPSLRVQVWSRDRRINFRIFLEEIIRDRWVHAEVRLADLRAYSGKGPLEAGDAVSNIMFVAGRHDDGTLHIDNFKVTAYSADASLPTTSAAIPIGE